MSENENNSTEQDAAQSAEETTREAANAAIARLEGEVAEARDRMLRAMAETENVRRRLEREKDEVARYAISKFAGDLLSVADNLRRALESAPESAQEGSEFLAKLVAGVGATERALLNVFEKFGLKTVDPSGEIFNPNFHEVLYEVPTPDQPAGTVVQVLEKGYTIGDRLLRPARVAVSKGGPKG